MKIRIVLCILLALILIPSLTQAQVNGDIDGDGDIDTTDAMILEQYLVGLRDSLSAPALETIVINIPNLPVEAIALEMTLIPAGTFIMGSPTYGPQHQVTLTQNFYLGKYEVTQAQWQAVMGSNPSGFSGNPNNPVETVSWDDSQVFITNLNQLGLGTFRLPTEAEWEYACRAGTTDIHYWGYSDAEDIIKQYCWYQNNARSPNWTLPHAEEHGTQPVGLKLPNPWGLFDMSGNVFEWCQNWYESYTSSNQTDPQGSSSGSNRVARGGCWTSTGAGGALQSAYRYQITPLYHDTQFGIRLLRLHP